MYLSERLQVELNQGLHHGKFLWVQGFWNLTPLHSNCEEADERRFPCQSLAILHAVRHQGRPKVLNQGMLLKSHVGVKSMISKPERQGSFTSMDFCKRLQTKCSCSPLGVMVSTCRKLPPFETRWLPILKQHCQNARCQYQHLVAQQGPS